MSEKEVCEWRMNYKYGFTHYTMTCNHSCSLHCSTEVHEWEYCPYCGKPIEVKEDEDG